MATLSPSAKQLFLNNAGQPAAGYSLYTYQSGTSTPLVTYSDKAATAPNANPIVLDARGEAIIYLLPQQYRYVLKDTLGATVWTRDNVSPSADSSDLAATSGASLIGFMQLGSGAVARTTQDKLREIVSVKDFGAKGDGSTDDTSAIQAAINYAATFGSGFGAEVVFPTGQYNYSALTISNSGVSLRGQGKAALVKTSATGNGLLVIGPTGRIYGAGIQNLQFSASVAQTSGAAVYITNAGQCKLDNLTFTSYPFPCFRGLQTNNVSQITADAISSQNCIDSGMLFTDTVDLYMVNSRSDANGSNGFSFDCCAGVYFGSCTAYNNVAAGWLIQKVATGVIANTSQYFHMVSCIGDTNGSHNWVINDTIQSEFTNCWASTQNNATADLHGIAVNGGCSYLEFNHCMALTNNGAGLIALSPATFIKITGGTWLANGKVAASTQRYGISCSASSMQINGAQCTDNQGTKTQQYGLNLSGGTTIMVKDCNFIGNAAGPYNIPTLPSNFIERDNIVNSGIVSLTAAATLPVPPVGDTFIVNGTTGITAISNVYAGRKITLIFNNTLTVTDGGTLKLAGNFTSTGVYSTLTLLSPDGTNWAEVSRAVN